MQPQDAVLFGSTQRGQPTDNNRTDRARADDGDEVQASESHWHSDRRYHTPLDTALRQSLAGWSVVTLYRGSFDFGDLPFYQGHHHEFRRRQGGGAVALESTGEQGFGAGLIQI